MPTKQEFLTYQARHRRDPAERAVLQDERRAQALVSIRMDDLLTGDAWTVFRQHLTVLQDSHVARMEDLEQQILSPTTVGDALLTRKLEYTRVAGVLEGLALACLLPEQLRHQAAAIEARLAGQLDNPHDPE